MQPGCQRPMELKATEWRWVFSRDFKDSAVRAALMFSGRLFQSSGAATEKARSPLDLSLDLRTSRTT